MPIIYPINTQQVWDVIDFLDVLPPTEKIVWKVKKE